ncbi:ribonuclease P protein component [Helicobacter cinaedi PAGU611]|uniref:Ribonuclease P protein component n=1 Tax=Helicobacter cinaedi CCUG 18818 = ATCC BAA-847 TaxID=537971 RepID=A0AAI8MJ38_9HELI|nr:ribonuclease P protein component [Helicobacter cinaedi]AWK61616.1 ribonuclease P protein component [Helicobacter cinaedi]EFR46976.1 ribonuclease P protein component [Helicobacter cinaedi CCUG 18818 = ATCC BAA-847]QOQ91523.1 ribonuclease P protein component [Helicobacter cinaedi]QOQ95720.1 ribonuclease P protein component [Helicobacter cinaedi]BAM15004.1 ribonuclease P protein component [Helicobacter cinaedi PAGU611]
MRLDSLKNKTEFDFIYKNAQRFFHKNFVLYALQISSIKPNNFRTQKFVDSLSSHNAEVYVGLSISRKVGKACVRNLLKRRLKAIMYENRTKLQDYIFVIVARESIILADFATLQRDILFACSKVIHSKIIQSGAKSQKFPPNNTKRI